jgi:hypothetical protein
MIISQPEWKYQWSMALAMPSPVFCRTKISSNRPGAPPGKANAPSIGAMKPSGKEMPPDVYYYAVKDHYVERFFDLLSSGRYANNSKFDNAFATRPCRRNEHSLCRILLSLSREYQELFRHVRKLLPAFSPFTRLIFPW